MSISIILKVLGVLAWVLKNGWIKGGLELPLPVSFWKKLHDSLIDDKKFTKDEAIALFIILREKFGWKWAFDGLIKILSYLKDFTWSVEGKYEEFWKPILVSAADGFLTWAEAGMILGAVVDWVKNHM